MLREPRGANAGLFLRSTDPSAEDPTNMQCIDAPAGNQGFRIFKKENEGKEKLDSYTCYIEWGQRRQQAGIYSTREVGKEKKNENEN